MQSSNGRILLSPSDLNDYVNCRHLTTLAREVARGERKAPYERTKARSCCRKRGSCTSSHFSNACMTKVARCRDRDGRALGFDLPLRVRRTRCSAALTSSRKRPSCSGHGGAAPTSYEDPEPSELGPWSYRGARREARPCREADLHTPALLLQRRHRHVQGRCPEHMHVLLGIGEQRTLR